LPAAVVGEGRDTFNGNCAHCHGGDATQSDDAINLRRLKARYGADAKLAFDTTVREGRPGTLMQSWKETFGEDEYRKIWAWLQTVQAKD
jgi:mono/diheme cytochrome c family protein